MDGILNDLHLSLAAGSQQTAQQPEPDKESAEVSKAVVPNRAVPPTPPGQRVMDGILNDLHLSLAAGSQAQQPEPDKESAEVSKDVVGANEMPSVALSQAGEATQTEAGKDKVNQSEEVAAARPSVRVVKAGKTTYRALSNFMKKKASPEGGAARPGTGEDNTSAPLEGRAATAEGGAAPLAEGGDTTSAPLEGGAATLAATQVATAPPQWTCWKCEWADVDPEKDACLRCRTLICCDCLVHQDEGGCCPQCGFKPPTPGPAPPAESADKEVVPLSPQNRTRGRGRGGSKAKRGRGGGGAQQPPKRPRTASARGKAKAQHKSDGEVAWEKSASD